MTILASEAIAFVILLALKLIPLSMFGEELAALTSLLSSVLASERALGMAGMFARRVRPLGSEAENAEGCGPAEMFLYSSRNS